MHKFPSFRNSRHIPCSTIKCLFSFFSSLPKTRNSSPVFLNYLIESFNFSKSRAIALSIKYPHIKSLEKQQSVCQFFKNIGFSDAQIYSAVRGSPEILVCDVDKTLKPKIEFLQNLGVKGSDLGTLVSKNSFLLTASLEKKLIPFIEILKRILVDDKDNELLFRTLRRCRSLISRDLKSRLLTNVELFKSCGIVGSQLSMLLCSKPRVFDMPESKLKGLVSQLSDMGVSANSRMFVYGLRTLSSLSEETFGRKLELFESFGFSKDEVITLFRKAPWLLAVSEEKLKSGLEFFLKKVELEKATLFSRPNCLTYSMENRVIPRYRVFKIVMSRRLLKKMCSLLYVLSLTEENFLQKFVLRFGDDAEELLLAYKGLSLGT